MYPTPTAKTFHQKCGKKMYVKSKCMTSFANANYQIKHLTLRWWNPICVFVLNNFQVQVQLVSVSDAPSQSLSGHETSRRWNLCLFRLKVIRLHGNDQVTWLSKYSSISNKKANAFMPSQLSSPPVITKVHFGAGDWYFSQTTLPWFCEKIFSAQLLFIINCAKSSNEGGAFFLVLQIFF